MTTDPSTHDPDPARWEVIERAFQQASELSGEERTAVLDETCGDDSGIRREVEAMLAADGDTNSDFLCSPVLGGGASAVLEETSDAFIGKTIGRYHIKSIIARGGMGTVYEAVQESPHRVVALKILRRNIASRSALRRFQYESQILSRMRHPNIAPVYEAGVYDDGEGGVPYFAMEYIPGAKTITAYVESKQLSTRARLELFAKVCDAAHHGHQKGIIHRDLKPANILVDSSGQPQVIDFGVARSTDSDLAVTTQQTDIGQLIGTMQYMSPEQCDGDPHDLDTRSDVYSLGVVLYELLTGHPPYNAASSTIYQAARMIREQVPVPLSSINRKLRGDVETIVLKALEKDRDKRYQSAEVLKQEIERFLHGEPIEARRAGAWVHCVRWVCRHPVVTTAGACVSIALLVFAATWVVVWYGMTQPMGFQAVSDDWRTVHLVSPFGNRLATLGGESNPGSNVQAMLVNRPGRFGGGKVALFTVREGERSTGRQLWMCDPKNLDDPIWRTDPFETLNPPEVPAAWNSSKEDTDWVVADFFVANALPDTPEDEIVVVHEPRTGSSWAIRIYDFTGELQFEAWHMGYVKEIHWWEEEGLLVCGGDRHGRLDISRHGYSKNPFRWPLVAYAVRPQRGVHVRGWLNEVGWPKEWRTDPNVENVLVWYKTVMPRALKETFFVSGIFTPVVRGGRDPLVYISVTSYASNESHELSSFRLGLDATGKPHGLDGSDSFYESRDLLPEEDPFLTDWPPPPVDDDQTDSTTGRPPS